MLRRLHSIVGLALALLVTLLALTGAVLSVDPALERSATSVPAGVSVASLVERVLVHYPGVEQIQRTRSGTLLVYFSSADQAGVDRVDPATGAGTGPHLQSPVMRWVKQLHRSMLLDTPGRVAAGITAVAMLLLSVSGLLLLVRRIGGWRQVFAALHGNRSQRWHAQVGRLAVAGLMISALTGTWLSATTLGLVADGMQAEPDFPATTAGGLRKPAPQLPALIATDLSDLRDLVFPRVGDAGAVYTLRTTQGDGYVDPATGEHLAFRAHGATYRAHEWLYRIHTGEGLWWLGLLLGLCALGAPWLAATGATVWWQRRQARPRITGNDSAQSADAVVLVGSENNSTWGFARVLHDALRKSGQRVHTAPMNAFSARHRTARRLFILTATYGDGDAPASASQFLALSRQVAANPATTFAVLGFGDRQFPKFCQFAQDVDAAMRAQGWLPLMALTTINRQSTQEFARWGTALGERVAVPLSLEHTPVHPPTVRLRLRERIDYGVHEQEPTVILRFVAAADAQAGWFARITHRNGLPSFEAGDLAGVVAPGSPMPRFYSLASSARNGMLEICVRRQPGGLCSTFLHGLAPGDSIDAFVQANPEFRPASGRTPVILIGAGTGIGPLAGFIRNNTGRHPMYLYWGGRDPASDFLYEPELRNYLADRRLTQLHTAFSRVVGGVRVQTRLAEDAANLRTLVKEGAQVLVCGSSTMAGSVRQALDEVLAPIVQDVNTLRSSGRYREDVF